MIVSDAAIDREAVWRQLTQVLQSRVFAKAQRSRRFLRYLVDAALAQPPITVKEYTIAIDVFDRDTAYNPAVDATVRVEASRLRSRLREYYDEEGRDDPWRIELPKGAYALAFHPLPVSSSGKSPALETPLTAEAASVAPARPARKIPRYVWAACGLTLLAVGMAAWRYRRLPTPSSASPVSLAILPIADRTGDPALNYVVDGLTDDLIRQLSQVPALKLIARTTVFHYRDRATDAQAIGKALGVDTVMTGELRRSLEHESLSVEMSRTSDGSVLLDREYIVDANDLAAVQARLQRDVLARLHVESSALDPTRKQLGVTTSPQAYQEFLEGSELARSGAPSDIHQALAHLQKAVALDPQFDLAWSALASEHVLLGLYFEPPREHMPQARRYAQRALQINPSLAEAHGSLGIVHLVYDWDIPAAQAEVGMAGAEVAAVNTLACTVHLIERAGSPRTAEEMVRRQLTYDPQSAGLIAELGCVDYYRGDYEAALRYYRQALVADPRSPVPYWGIGKTLNAQGKYAEAIAVLKSFRQRNGFEPPLLTAEIGYALGASGARQQAIAVARGLSANDQQLFVDPYLVAVVYASMHDRDAAFAWLNRAMDVRSSFVISLLTEPKWQPYRDDPRFAQLIGRMLHSKAG